MEFSEMDLKLLLALRFAILLGACFPTEANIDVGFPISEANAFSECGGLLTSNSGQILYKMFEQVGNNERCVWMVSPPKSISFNVRVSADFEYKDGFLNVGGLFKGFGMGYSYRFSSTWTNVVEHVLVITFQSPHNATNRGFVLEYEMVRTDWALFTSHSFNHLDTHFIKFPIGRDFYNNFELSTLVFPVMNNVYEPGVMRYLVYKLISIQLDIRDFVEVYSFNSTANQFVSIGKATGNNDTLQFSSDDMMIVTFHSDSSKVGEGFFLSSVSVNSTCTI